jgi:hypothetical protein
MKLILGKSDATQATLHVEGSDDCIVTVMNGRPNELAAMLARSFNRSRHFDALFAALSPFRSAELGNLLISVIDTREQNADQAQRALGRLVAMIDVILDAVERDSEEIE